MQNTREKYFFYVLFYSIYGIQFAPCDLILRACCYTFRPLTRPDPPPPPPCLHMYFCTYPSFPCFSSSLFFQPFQRLRVSINNVLSHAAVAASNQREMDTLELWPCCLPWLIWFWIQMLCTKNLELTIAHTKAHCKWRAGEKSNINVWFPFMYSQKLNFFFFIIY